MTTGLKIKQYLIDHGILQSFISAKCNISAAKLNLALNGKRRLTFSEYEAICWALGVGVDTFLTPQPPVIKGANE